MTEDLFAALEKRFGERPPEPRDEHFPEAWHALAVRGSCRTFLTEPLEPALIETLCALALCAPTKSDLQQRDIIIVEDAGLRHALDRLLTDGPLGQPWIADAPHLLVFCANNRRQRLLHDWRSKDFANDHLDAFYNAALDAGIAMAQFMVAAEAAGLGCCPISAIRNEAEAVSELLGLPLHVFPAVALALGRPAAPPKQSYRLPLSVTLHKDRYHEDGLAESVTVYDERRAAAQPYAAQRYPEDFGQASSYGWSEDKARQYAKPERAGFGRYVRKAGFLLD